MKYYKYMCVRISENSGEVVLRLGRAFIDFPVAPAIHVAIHRAVSLELVLLLLRNEADMNSYIHPSDMDSSSSINDDGREATTSYVSPQGYPPAIIFAIGGIDRPTSNAHAALVKQLHERYPHTFNRSRLQQWIDESHRPPILHLTIIANNFDMTYVMVSEFAEHLRDDRDVAGLSALVRITVHAVHTYIPELFYHIQINKSINFN